MSRTAWLKYYLCEICYKVFKLSMISDETFMNFLVLTSEPVVLTESVMTDAMLCFVCKSGNNLNFEKKCNFFLLA